MIPIESRQTGKPVFFLFPGGGSERPNMTRGLYENDPGYREMMNRCLKIGDSLLDFDLRHILFPDTASIETARRHMSQPRAALPSLFVTEYCLAMLLQSEGVDPDGMIGHSFGEYAAACLAGVFSLETALQIVIKRGQLIQELPEGSMLAVALPESKISPYLNDRVELGSTLAQEQCVVTGYPDAVRDLRHQFGQMNVQCKEVKVNRAYHSMMLDPVLEDFEAFLSDMEMNPPSKRFISGVDGQWIDAETVCTKTYWVRQLRQPVRFFEGVTTLSRSGPATWVEVGRGSVLTNLVRGHQQVPQTSTIVTTCPSSQERMEDADFFNQSLARIKAGSGADPKNKDGAGKTLHTEKEANPPDEMERKVVECFCQVLGLPEMEASGNFLEAGGNSLMAMRVLSRFRDQLKLELPIRDFFEDPTVSGVARRLRQLSGQVNSPDPLNWKETTATGRSATTDPVPMTKPKRHSLQPSGADAMRFSLFFFSGDENAYPNDRYKLVLEAAKFADEEGFEAVWIPERHFNKFGGLYPNPSVLGAALAAITRRVHIRGGSVVAPLHHPVRIAEEWSVLDNLSKGRVGVSFGSGFHPKDFLFAPDAFANRKAKMFEAIKSIRGLWAGKSYTGPSGLGEDTEVGLFPTPYSEALPIWLSTTRDQNTFREAGEHGAHLLTALLRLSRDELRERIAIYRTSREKAGYDPATGTVTLMLHTFLGDSMDHVRSTVSGPLKTYLRIHMEHTQAVSSEKAGGMETSLSPQEEEELLDHAFNRYFASSSLMGTEESCLETIETLRGAGVNEVACLIDFGVEHEALMRSLRHLANLQKSIREGVKP